MIINKSSPIPQYFQLQTWLMEQIDQGILKHGVQIPTEKELREMTGLARATIRQAIGNLVNMGHLVRKRRLGTFVQDPLNETEKRTIIGILIPDIRSGYAPELARGTEDETAKHQHSLILCNTDDLFMKAEHHADRLIKAAVSGVIFVPTAHSHEKNRLIIEKFTKKNIPVVLADRTIPEIDIDHVTTNNFDGAYELTSYLIQRGHRKIAIILSERISTEKERLEGYRAALKDHDIPIDSSIVIPDAGPFDQEHYRGLVRELLGHRGDFTAIFAGHDRIALIIYSVAHDMGLAIPDDFSLTGYDDLPYVTIKLTTMHQPIYEMGQESLKLIMSRIQGERATTREIVLKAHLVERSSVKDIRMSL